MSLAHKSIATISSPEFINLEPLDKNPLMSMCEIKVFYLGANRNGSYISKQVATEMAKNLRGAPIVGYYKENKEDFADHGEEVIWDDEGIHFNVKTVPYGFVSPDAKVWFKDFEDFDEFGNSVVRTYLMTTGYLWTGQFEEVGKALAEGQPQSMELDEKNLQGHWSENIKENMEFFIIDDAIFSKLCILGDDVEPCFEGASITAPEVSTSFSLDDNFKHTLFTMMEELKYALEGRNQVAKVDNTIDVKDEVVDNTFTENQTNESSSSENENPTSEFEAEEVEEVEESAPAAEEETEFAKKEDEEEEEKDDSEEPADDEAEDNDDSSEEEKDDDEDKKRYTALNEQYNNLLADFNALQEEIEGLREFKKNIETKQKDDLIEQFYMLSEQDKADVIANKEKYSLDEIKSKLAVICFEKKVSFNSENSSENNNQTEEITNNNVITYEINDSDSTADWIKAVESNMNEF